MQTSKKWIKFTNVGIILYFLFKFCVIPKHKCISTTLMRTNYHLINLMLPCQISISTPLFGLWFYYVWKAFGNILLILCGFWVLFVWGFLNSRCDTGLLIISKHSNFKLQFYGMHLRIRFITDTQTMWIYVISAQTLHCL